MTPAEVVRAFYAALVDGDRDRAVELLADEVTWTLFGETPISGEYVGKASVVRDFLGRAVPNLRPGSVTLTVRTLVANGDIAVIEYLNEATTRAGERYEMWYLVLHEVRDGLIRAVRQYVDTQYLQRALFDDG